MKRHAMEGINRSMWSAIGVFSCVILLLSSCIREELNLNEDSPIAGDLKPSWVVPLGQLEVTINDHWDLLDSLQIEANETDGMLHYVQPFDVFSSAPMVLEPLQESLSFDWILDEASASGISLLPEGEMGSFESSANWNWGLLEMSSLDSLWLGAGTWDAEVTSLLPMDLEVKLVASNVLSDGEPLETILTLAYTGTLPVTASQSIDLEGRSVLFSEASNPVVPIVWEVEWLGSGAEVNAGEALTVEVSISETTVEGAFGEFAETAAWPFEMGQSIPVLEGMASGLVHFADPQIHLWMRNSSGIPLGIEWDEVVFLEGGVPSYLTGSAWDEFPVIAAALLPGDDAETTHIIDNSGTSPTLTNILDAMPDSMHLSGAISINPGSTPNNFLLATSRVSLEGELRLPMNGWASAMQWTDTVDVDLSEALEEALNPPLDWQDIDAVTVRFRCENALPVGVRVQAFFLNGQGELIDSLGVNPNGWQLIEPGMVSSNGQPDDADYGRVIQPALRTIDWVFDRELAQDLVGQDVRQVVIHTMLETTDASNNQDVRFYPEDGLRLELGLRVDFDLTWNP
jgi:hypothetical protein